MKEIRSVKFAFAAWTILSALIAVSIIFISMRWGQKGFDLFIQQWPLTSLPIVLASVAITWLLFGALLYLLQRGHINRSNLLFYGGFFLTGWVYLNSLSERYRYGDYAYYQEAALSLVKNQNLPNTYFYLPLWATLLKPIALLETDMFLLVLWLANFFSFLIFFILLHHVLVKYGFSPRLSACATTLFMLVNAPLLRTLDYVQVNIHALNFILASLLLFEKRPFLSALMLAFAVHLKTSPIVLALAFLLERDWRWTGWLLLNLTLLAAVTFAANGAGPFFDVFNNLKGLALSSNTIFHDTSFDSFLRFIGPFLRFNTTAIRILIYAAKVLLAGVTLVVMARSVKNQMFYESKERGARLFNALPPLLILMTLASPVVWEHHGIFVGLSFLLLLKRLESPADWMWFGFAYFLEFILPTFDFFPWSYGRLVAPLIVLWLMWRATKQKENAPLFSDINARLDQTSPLEKSA